MTSGLLAVGFDLDYTLWDQDAFAGTFFCGIARELGGRIGCGHARVERALRGTLDRLTSSHPHLFDEALRGLGVEDPRLVAELVERYHRHRPPVRPYPGARAALSALRGRGLRLFLVTDGASETQRYKIEALGLRDCFEERIYTGDFPRILQKPSAFPFLLACRRMGLRPRQCAFVGDNPKADFEGPMALGMLTIGVSSGPFAGQAGLVPHRRIHRLEELEDLL